MNSMCWNVSGTLCSVTICYFLSLGTEEWKKKTVSALKKLTFPKLEISSQKVEKDHWFKWKYENSAVLGWIIDTGSLTLTVCLSTGSGHWWFLDQFIDTNY